MKILFAGIAIGVVAALAGCVSTTEVQEMIDASRQDYTNQLKAHDNSIDILRKSSMTGLEKSKENAAELAAIQAQLEEIIKQMKVIQGYADAAKVMSAANTVKVANLEDTVNTNQEKTDKTIAKMTAIDKLYEEVLIRQYQMIASSANAAIASLKADGMTANTNAPVKLDKPIEIIAPKTTTTTNPN